MSNATGAGGQVKKAARPNAVTVFCDFDGTIAQEDIGNAFVQHFGTFEELHRRLMDGELSVAEYWRLTLDSFPSGTGEQDIRDYVLQFDLDPYFLPFTRFCAEQDWPLTVASDGFASYIEPLLKKAGLAHLPLHCNRIDFAAGAKPRPVFPGATESCTCFCASCKRNVLLNASPADAIVIFVGDGHSDTCAAEHADLIFAKDALAAHCNKQRIPHHTYRSFFDVIYILEKSVREKSLRPRHQAQLKRREAFIVE